MSFYPYELIKERYGKQLSEIGQLKPSLVPYDSIKLVKDGPDYFFHFDDPEGERIDIKIVMVSKGTYNIAYGYGDNDKKYKDTSTKHLFSILSTVVTVVKKFLAEVDPNKIRITGTDKDSNDLEDPDKYKGQKNTLYKMYIRYNIDHDKYNTSQSGDTIYIEKKTNELQEVLDKRDLSFSLWNAIMDDIYSK